MQKVTIRIRNVDNVNTYVGETLIKPADAWVILSDWKLLLSPEHRHKHEIMFPRESIISVEYEED